MAFTKNHGEPAWLDLPDDLLGYHEAFPKGKSTDLMVLPCGL
jgi:uncharacterized protein (DUF3820 family)